MLLQISLKRFFKASRRSHFSRSRSRQSAGTNLESLEQRIVLSGVAAAQADVTAKQGALNSALSTFQTNVTAIESTLQSNMNGHWNDYNNAVHGSGGIYETFDSDIASIDAGLTVTLQGRDSTFAATVAPFEQTLEGALDTADGQRDSDIQTASGILNGSLQTAQTNYDSGIATADGNFYSAEGAAWAIWDPAFQGAESNFDSDILAADSTLNGSVNSAQSGYDTAEQGFWSTFETNTGDTPGNLGDTYNINVASEEATRQGVESLYPSLTYDTWMLDSDPAYWSLISSADMTFDSNMQTHENDFDTNMQSHQSDFDSNMATHTASYDTAVQAADSVWDNAVYGPGGAQEDYDTAISAAENGWDSAVNGPGGIQEAYDNAIMGSENQFYADMSAAEAAFLSTLVPAVTAYDSAVAQAQQDYDDWLDGGTAGTAFSQQTTVVAYDFFDPTVDDKWQITTTITATPSGETTTTVATSFKAPAVSGTPVGPPVVTTTSTATVTTTIYSDGISASPSPSVRMNVFELALYNRTEQFDTAMQSIANQYYNDYQGLVTTHDATVQTALQTYDSAVNGLGGFADTYYGAVNSASQQWDTNVQNAENAFYTFESNFWMNWNMMDPMDPLQQEVKNFELAVHNANLTYIGAISGPFVTYVTQEAAQNTQLVRDVIQASFDLAMDDADLKLDRSQKVIDLTADYLKDVTDINADFAKADAEKQMNYEQTVAGAENTYLTAQNAAAETRAKDVAQAAKDDSYRQAAAMETYLDGLAGENKIRSKAYADAQKTYSNDVAQADHDWIDSEAAAYKDLTKDWNLEIEDLQNDAVGEYVDLLGDYNSEVVTWTTTVAGGIEPMMTSIMGGGADAAAVASAWRTYSINVTNEAVNYSNGAAGEWQTYSTSANAAWKSAADLMADAVEIYDTQLADDYKDYVSDVANADRTYNHSVADAAEIHVQQTADAEKAHVEEQADAYKIYGDADAEAYRAWSDSYLAAAYGFVGSYLPAEQNHIENVIDDIRNAEKNKISKAQTAESNLLTEEDDLHRDSLNESKTAADDAADEDDPVVIAAADLEVAQAKLSEELAKQETSNRSISEFDTWIGWASMDVYLDATSAFFSSIGTGLVNMASGIVSAVIDLADTAVLGLIDLGMTAYGVWDPYYRWDAVSTVGQGTQQFLNSGGTLQEFYTDTGITMAADIGTLGGYSYYQGYRVYAETGDPTQWQQASGELLLDVILERAPAIKPKNKGRIDSACPGNGQCFVAGTPVWMGASETSAAGEDTPDFIAASAFALVGVTGMKLIQRTGKRRRKPAKQPVNPKRTKPVAAPTHSPDSGQLAVHAQRKSDSDLATEQCFAEFAGSEETTPLAPREMSQTMKDDVRNQIPDRWSRVRSFTGTAWLLGFLLLGTFVGLRGTADAVVQQQPVHRQQAIETIRVGQRVLTAAPEGISLDVHNHDDVYHSTAPQDGKTAVDPATWRLIRMRAEQKWNDGTVDDINIETLQPLTWLKRFQIVKGGRAPIPLDLVEMGIDESLSATVLDILPCPEIEKGPGRVVLTTVDHLNHDVLELTVRHANGETDSIRTTGAHKFYDLTSGKWASASELTSGHHLHGMTGPIEVLASHAERGTHRVYNMTVEEEHVYRVADSGVLVHNTNCFDPIGRPGFSNPDLGQQVHNNFLDALVQQTGTTPQDWHMRTAPGETGVDATYIGPDSLHPGFDHAELKPFTEWSFRKAEEQMGNWLSNGLNGEISLWYYNPNGVIGWSGWIYY